MWHKLFTSPGSDPHFSASVMQLLHTTTRDLILAIAGLAAAALALRWFSAPADVDQLVMPLLAAVAVLSLLAVWQLPRRFLATMIVWQIGLAGLVWAACVLLGEPALALLGAFLPLLAVVTLGWPAALVSGAVVATLIGWR